MLLEVQNVSCVLYYAHSTIEDVLSVEEVISLLESLKSMLESYILWKLV